MKEDVTRYFQDLQDRICRELEKVNGGKQKFQEDHWERPGGGGGRSRILENGPLFEKAGVNFSEVHGHIIPELDKIRPGEGDEFYATGISIVIHPLSPMIPSVHANLRFLGRGEHGWFGGGSDLTPFYIWEEDILHFHRTWKEVCDRFNPHYYEKFKSECDRYFFISHRKEARGIGGIFFDYQRDDLEHSFEFVKACGEGFLPAYIPIVERRKKESWSERERDWQLERRGRYVEFNLIYDRGTVFGIKTGGRIESILMSLPPKVEWKYNTVPNPGSREAELLEYLRPRDWLKELA